MQGVCVCALDGGGEATAPKAFFRSELLAPLRMTTVALRPCPACHKMVASACASASSLRASDGSIRSAPPSAGMLYSNSASTKA